MVQRCAERVEKLQLDRFREELSCTALLESDL